MAAVGWWAGGEGGGRAGCVGEMKAAWEVTQGAVARVARVRVVGTRVAVERAVAPVAGERVAVRGESDRSGEGSGRAVVEEREVAARAAAERYSA